MDSVAIIGAVSIIVSGLTIAIASIGPALGEARALAQALSSMAQQPGESNRLSRTLFIGLAMIESTAIYAFVISIIIIFVNPFWTQVAG